MRLSDSCGLRAIRRDLATSTRLVAKRTEGLDWRADPKLHRCVDRKGSCPHSSQCPGCETRSYLVVCLPALRQQGAVWFSKRKIARACFVASYPAPSAHAGGRGGILPPRAPLVCAQDSG